MPSKPIAKLNVEKLRKYKGFENITEEEAKEQIETIERVAKLFFEIYVSNNKANEKHTA